jgi:fructokinase
MRPKIKQYKLGIDLGGTKTEGIILDNDMNEVFRKRIPTMNDYIGLLDSLHELYKELSSRIEDKPHTFGIGTPGSTTKKTGLMKNSNIVEMNGKPFMEDLEFKLGRKISRQNDSNCFAIAEANLGAGRGKKRVFGAIMGTGIGGGYVVEGKLISGLQSIAGEWGHSIIGSVGPKCYCGKIGCIETFISGRGVENKYFEMFQERLSMNEIVKRYRLGDNQAKLIMSDFFVHFGKAFSNLITILDPDIIILGGGLSNIDELYTIGVNRVRDFVFNDDLVTPIVRNKCGDSAGVMGAALLGI